MTKLSSSFAVLTLLVSAAAFPSFMHGQMFIPEKESSSLAPQDLPDAPGAILERESEGQAAAVPAAKATYGSPKPEMAPKYKFTIPADMTAQPLTGGDKILLSLKSRVRVASIASAMLSSGIGYWRNDIPHYGTNLPAYGERFGAVELRQTSQAVFSYGIYAAAFHDDPRYYVMGSKEKVTKRAIYAATRVVITRKDDGRSAVNWPRILGVLSSAALTNAYYPPQDRRVGRTFSSSLSILGTTAATNQLNEFLGDIKSHLFHKKQDADQP